ncbi:response regulator, partial [Thermodesulfobacteriota bacterium]
VESLAMTMETRGFEVERAFSGEEAIEKFRSENFDITFMDVRLPGKNGVECFLEIRKFRPDARVVMMTGYSMELLLDQAVDNGAWGVLKKPFDLEKMFDILDRIRPDGVLIDELEKISGDVKE